ncbi:hypothetical protein ACFSUS_05500 [Spirosoma soli]|uniref:PIN domain-containing protein n=1 Tax=Spirosoma soli TaxID=1770529 RepID=A0ABW5LZ68_9BACT
MTLTELRNSRGLLVDTNLLVLLVVGQLGLDQINSYKRTSLYSAEDYKLLYSFVERFRRVVTTPNILTETSNLLEGYTCKEQKALALLESIAEAMDEIFYDSMPTMRAYPKSYLKFGLSDAVIHRVAEENYLVLTDDLNFCAYLQGKGLLAINFNNLRTDAFLH